MNKLLFFFLGILCLLNVNAQNLKPGFDPNEALMILNLSAHQFDSSRWKKYDDLPNLPNNFKLSYRSKEIGFNNRWDLFTNGKTAVISIRGTVGTMSSWIENFHAAMIPAEGSIRLKDSSLFNYKLADHPRAYVHIGWTYGLGSIAMDIVDKINAYSEKGYKDFYLVGFSQGAAIVQLLSSYLNYLPENTIPEDVKFKTFAFASPKPGNSFYSNDYSFIHRGGWEFSIMNLEDWVPRMPFSVQRIEDMPSNNPFTEVDQALRGLKPIQRAFLKGIYKKMKNKIDKAQKELTKTLGSLVGKFLSKSYPALETIDFVSSMDYVQTGTKIVITSAEMPDSLSYMQGIFFHHMPLMYYKRIQKDYQLSED